MKPSITIIGAGISGLTAAVYLHQKGYKIQILESSDRAGGRIKTDLIEQDIKKVFKYLFIDFRDASSHQLHVVFLLI